MFESMIQIIIAAAIIFGAGIFLMIIKMYRKVEQGKALVRNGVGGTKVTFTGMLVFPVLHRAEVMDISLKRVEIHRTGKDGLICKDNVRADIKVAFFVRVNKTPDSVLKVAQSIGCTRASDHQELIELFDAKFSEALKTVGKQFDFTELYTDREGFKQQIIKTIGTDLNGFILDDAAIDYLEQTPLSVMNADNILDSQGIKKIVEITASQKILSNQIKRDEEKTITKQDVEAKEAILELNKQLAEAEEKQKREIASIMAREEAETKKIQQEERKKAEHARITTDEELRIAEENKDRQIIVAQRNKERTDGVEKERVEKDRQLEATERERIVSLAQIEKDKAIEVERKNIQEVIRERVIVEKDVVVEEEKIKDTKAFAGAEREKKVAIVAAEQVSEEAKIQEVIAADAAKEAAKHKAEQQVIEAEADQVAATKKAEAMKTIASARAEEEAVIGMSEVRVMEAKANAIEKEGTAEANVMEKKAFAEAKGIEAKAAATQKHGEAEAAVMARKYQAEARGIEDKAEAMKKFDAVGKEHEEFKLKLNMQLDVELARINVQREIAEAQAEIIKEGLKSSKIEIIGGESMFFDKMIQSITQGKGVDRLVANSAVLQDVKNTFFTGDGEEFAENLRQFIGKFKMSSDDLKNLTISGLLFKLIGRADTDEDKYRLKQITDVILQKGLGDQPASAIQ